MCGLSLETRMSDLKSVALIVLNWSDWPVHCAQTNRQTDRTTSNKNSISAVHSIHLAEITIRQHECLTWQYNSRCRPTINTVKFAEHWPPSRHISTSWTLSSSSSSSSSSSCAGSASRRSGSGAVLVNSRWECRNIQLQTVLILCRATATIKLHRHPTDARLKRHLPTTHRHWTTHTNQNFSKSLVLTFNLACTLFVCLHPPYETQFPTAFVPANL